MGVRDQKKSCSQGSNAQWFRFGCVSFRVMYIHISFVMLDMWVFVLVDFGAVISWRFLAFDACMVTAL
jgi:hypothetical protein